MTLPLGLSGSDLIDRRVLQAERDVARAERRADQAERAQQAMALQLDQSRQIYAAEAAHVRTLQGQIDKIYASTSWRMSRPVRVVSKILAVLRRRGTGRSGIAPPGAAADLAAIVAPAAASPVPLGSRERAILLRLQGRAPV